MAGNFNGTIYGDNVDFSGGTPITGKVTTDGQLLIGATAAPNIRVATLTEGTGIDITNGAGSITISFDGSEVPTIPLSFPTDSGTATPALNALTVAGGTGMNTSGAAATVTINLDVPVDETNGGTAQTTYATGDILYASAADTLSKLTIGSAGEVLTVTGGVPTWEPNASGDVSGPGSSTDNALVRWDGLTGTVIQDGVITEDNTGNMLQSAAVSGASLSIQTLNTSNTASATAYHQVQVAGSTASDAYYIADISGGQGYSWGVDNSDSDAWVLSATTTPGTTNVMRVSTAGEINYPLQPAFLAYVNTTIPNVTGDGTEYTIIFDTEVYDQNSDFNLGTSTFTAPVTGKYFIQFTVICLGGSVISGATARIVTSNRTYASTMSLSPGSTGAATINMSVIADMDASDTCTFTVLLSDSGGKIDDVSGTTSGNLRTYVSGKLSC